ncbi:MAG: redox-regulated ATPase YchF [Armatimonadetes bacterium]|nr:redox-regulated ATPase YchF [Armatimonadota bacterium]
MKVGIIGKPGSGKTTLFQAISRGQAQHSHTKEPVHSVVTVPDPRFEYFVGLYNPKKISPATIDFVDDIARLGTDRGREYSDEAMGELRTADALVLVVDAFETSPPDPDNVQSEVMQFMEELTFRDLMVLENRLERIAKQLRGPQAAQNLRVEQQAVEKMKAALEQGQRYSDVQLDETERKSLAGFQLLTAKPTVVAINVGEDIASEADELFSATLGYLTSIGIQGFCLSADIEKEISELEEADQKEYLAGLGISEPVADKMIRAIYSSCRLITFFTVSEKEVHAWPLRTGSTALEAADSIHSDLARGFIRAEVVSWEDIREAEGWDPAKAAGKLKLVGKEHIIEDGDSLFIRFKV